MIKPKQVEKFLSAFVGLSGLTVSNASTINVTSQLTTILATAGDGGSAVPVQQATQTQMGVVVSGNNECDVWDATTLQPIVVSGNPVFGRISFNSGNYIVSLFTDVNGTETAATIDETVRIAIPYRFSFGSLPQDALVLWQNLSPADSGAVAGTPQQEPLTVTANNTFNNLSKQPLNPATARMTVNGQVLYAGVHFTINVQAITISAAQADAIGYVIAPTDYCIMEYVA